MNAKKSPSATKLAAIERGKQAELRAIAYLEQQGLFMRQHNFRCKAGEIDVIMQHNHVMVFVEVKYRSNKSFGGALLSLHYRQRQRIIRAASYYLMRYAPDAAARFDVIALEGDEIEWLANAFSIDD